MTKSQIHRGRNAPHSRSQRNRLSINRIPADFGWLFLNRLLTSCRPFLTPSFVADVDYCIRSRDLLRYHALSKRWSALWAADPLEVGPPWVASMYYEVCKLLTKTEGMDAIPPQERRRACIDEVVRLDRALDCPILLDPDDEVFRRTRFWVHELMGAAPTSEELVQRVRHGPGSTAETAFKDRHAYFKYANWPYAVTLGCRDRFKQMIATDERWLGSLEQDYRRRLNIAPWSILNWDAFWRTVLVTRESNVVTSVPKNGLKDRAIAKEPLGNVFVQCGLGDILKDRLKAASGVDLRDQRRNRRLARLASMWNHPLSPCTLDLSSASDTVAEALVQAVVPSDWFAYLHSTRSEWGETKEFSFTYKKWSSMGNATTFELESIVFLALLYAVIDVHGDRSDRQYTSVFGDDLVFPRYLSSAVQAYLGAFGFRVNVEKSFTEGCFFESCGTDWRNGFNIRPFFLRRIPETVTDMVLAHNQLYCWCVRCFGCEPPRHLTEWLRSYTSVSDVVGKADEACLSGWFFQNGSPPRRQIVSVARSHLAGDIWFRKLQHNLLSCASDDGSRFDIPREEGLRLSDRAPEGLGYTISDSDGCQQDLDWPKWETVFATSP